MFNSDDIVFGWFEKSYSGRTLRPTCGPHGWFGQTTLTTELFHTREQLLSLSLMSDTKKKRIASAKPGTEVLLIRAVHSGADLIVKRLTDEEKTILLEALTLKEKISNLNKQIYEATIALQQEKSKLTSALNNTKKTLDKYSLRV